LPWAGLLLRSPRFRSTGLNRLIQKTMGDLMRTRLLGLTATLGLAVLLVPLVASPASAHEARTVGKYHFVVGFGDEPAYQGEKNSVQLLLGDANDKPVTDLGDSLKVEVSTDTVPGQTLPLALEPFFEVGEFGTPGDYRAFFIPTRPGKYTFHFTGSVKGQKVDQRFTSSSTGFGEVEDPANVEFPAKDPTTGQLAQRLDQQVPRLETAVAAARKQGRDDARRALIVAIVGVVIGLAGVGLALTRRPAARPASQPEVPSATAKQ
jgi:hypothetical protein